MFCIRLTKEMLAKKLSSFTLHHTKLSFLVAFITLPMLLLLAVGLFTAAVSIPLGFLLGVF